MSIVPADDPDAQPQVAGTVDLELGPVRRAGEREARDVSRAAGRQGNRVILECVPIAQRFPYVAVEILDRPFEAATADPRHAAIAVADTGRRERESQRDRRAGALEDVAGGDVERSELVGLDAEGAENRADVDRNAVVAGRIRHNARRGDP